MRKNINKLVALNTKHSINVVLDHYSNMFYNKIVNVTKVLSEAQLKEFSRNYVSMLIDKTKKYDGDFAKLMVIRIIGDSKALTEEKLLMYYCIYSGVNSKVLNYFFKRCCHLLDYYVGLNCYAYLSSVFKEDLKEILSSLKRATPSVEILAKNRLNERYKAFETDYDTMRKNVFNRYKNLIDNNILLALIDDEIKECLKIYADKTGHLKKKDISFKMYTDLEKYLLRKKTEETYEASIILEKERNANLVEMALISFNGFYPNDKAYDELYGYYDSQIVKYYERKRNVSVKTFLLNSLYYKVQKMNDKYGTRKDVLSLKKKIIESGVIRSDSFSEVYDNWANYYMESYPLRGVTFREFALIMLTCYDKESYDEILKVKEKNKCLVLKR